MRKPVKECLEAARKPHGSRISVTRERLQVLGLIAGWKVARNYEQRNVHLIFDSFCNQKNRVLCMFFINKQNSIKETTELIIIFSS